MRGKAACRLYVKGGPLTAMLNCVQLQELRSACTSAGKPLLVLVLL